ncbi:DNA-directed RNA polymerase subunit H [Halococcoides cellulosivorans]|uniref:DNA-directed RNA polymerase subunit Rpo5 n=1 Tax=Halococcoides cellulosivorans TaxID=1679096 RepID=A0A2R4X261_9EURY|nr:DNA-directed RNA polymerase subunit H [Halococcoides cellulosivorans]AWB27886.1 DNA-directed RNA polymerase subunit H [Halococcoides cellulosivorans]
MVNVSAHELVPDHSILDSDDLEDVLAEYNIRKTDLPKIASDDPALPEKADVGDVIRIIRDSRTTDTAVNYRLVTE